MTSLVQDIIIPIIGAVTGGLDFSNYNLSLPSKVQAGLPYVDAEKQGAVVGYGQFLTLAVSFGIVVFVLFLLIRGMNRLRTNEEAKPKASAEIPADVKLPAEICDLLARRPMEATPVAAEGARLRRVSGPDPPIPSRDIPTGMACRPSTWTAPGAA